MPRRRSRCCSSPTRCALPSSWLATRLPWFGGSRRTVACATCPGDRIHANQIHPTGPTRHRCQGQHSYGDLSMIEFTRLSQNATRTAAVVGDSIATVIGGPLGTFPSMTVDVITQPSGADLLSGGTAVEVAAAMTATFAVTGRYVLSVGAGAAPNLRA